MANTRDTKRIERLLELTQEKRKLLRAEIEAGSSLQAEYDGETVEEQKYSERLKELRAHNARVAADEPAAEPTAKKNADKKNADKK